ncbi:MAG: rhodanese-like domain-containing protein [Gammaproteobacteria bacterium]|nr:rhodanese-like domain-containing protein [Gammaproteobacteria bacterium]
MKKLLLMVMLGLFYGSQLAAVEFPGPLVKGEWLANNIDEVVVLDVRKNIKSFTDGHIPGAILVDVKEIRIERDINDKNITRMRPDPASFEKFMRAHGINSDSIVVLTHRGKTSGQVTGAARLYWHMKYFGFDRVTLLDGGNPSWVASLEDLVTEVDTVTPGNYVVGDEKPDMVATMEQVRAAMQDDAVTLIDTRELRYHVGLEKKDYVYANGHIPGSRNMPYKFLNPMKGGNRYFDRESYLSLLDSLRINTGDSLILYCNSGYEASSAWFVLREILGKQDVKLYDGSLHQWTQYETNPMTTRLAD